MYSRGCTYGRISAVTCVPTAPRFPCPPEVQWGSFGQNHLAYKCISLRLSHGAAAAEEEEKKRQDPGPVPAIRRYQVINHFTTPSLRFITFDQPQHDLGLESKEAWERERYSHQIASFLPLKSASQPKDKRLQRVSYAKNKEDKLFINKLLKDKGLHSDDWRIALSALLKHYKPEKTIESKDNVTREHAPCLVQNAGSHSQDLCASNEYHVPVRRVTSGSRNYRSFRLARKISTPAEWSEASLAVYVEALAESQKTQARVPWVRKPRLKGWANIGDIVTAFETVFYSPGSQKSLSVEACNTALRFYYDHGMMTKARSLYIRMEDLKMCIPTETFNILLRGSASQRDLHSFTFLLNNMTGRGFKPNEVTWTHLLQVIDDIKVRAVIVRKMAEKNMLEDIGIRRDVAAHMIQYEFVNYLGNGHHQRSFLEHMNNRYGIGWLSTTAGNKLLNEVAKHKSPAESLNLLYELKEAGFMPNDISMRTLLRHCSPIMHNDLATEILWVFKTLHNLYPGPLTYEMLFLQAWRNRLLNLATAIWRSACIHGAVSRKMRYLISRSLLSYTPALDKKAQSYDMAEYSNSSRGEKFQKFAGRFVIGMGGSKAAALSKAMDALILDPRRRALKWAQVLLQNNLRISKTCLLKDDLSQLLRQALTLDKTWAAEGLYKKDDWREMFPHAITVDVEVRNRRIRRLRPRLRSPSRNLSEGVEVRNGLVRRLRARLRRPSRKLSEDVQTRMGKGRIKTLCTADSPVESRQRTWPIRPTLTPTLSSIWRRSSIRRSLRPRSRLRSMSQS